jgi:hypothetical protein
MDVAEKFRLDAGLRNDVTGATAVACQSWLFSRPAS